MSSKNQKKRRPYPPKHKRKRAELARKTKPWEAATGPRTERGKAICAQNALKHGTRSSAFTKLRKALKENQKRLDTLSKSD